MTSPSTGSAGQADGNVALVAALMAQLNITADQLPHTATPARASRPMPTFDDYIPQVADGVVAGTRRVYDTYWRRILDKWGHRRIDEPTPLEIKQFAEHVRENAVVRRNHRGGA